MKSIYLEKPFVIGVRDIPEPVRKEGEVKIQVLTVGACGSDVAAFKGVSPLCTYPRVIGHEIIGRIMETDTNKRGLKAGELVALEPYIYCGKCFPCSIGRTNCCENLKVLGVHIDGGMCEFFCHPAELTHRVPENIPGEELALAEPLTIALHALHRVKAKKGEHLVILGAGPIGNLAAQVARYYGIIPILVDIIDGRLDLAKTVGVEFTINSRREDPVAKVKEITAGRMAECVIEATGATSAIRSVLELASFTGRIALVGWPNSEIPLPTRVVTFKELNVYGSRTSSGEFPEAIKLISEKNINVKALISKVVSMEEMPGSIKDLAERPEEFMKIIGNFRAD